MMLLASEKLMCEKYQFESWPMEACSKHSMRNRNWSWINPQAKINLEAGKCWFRNAISNLKSCDTLSSSYPPVVTESHVDRVIGMQNIKCCMDTVLVKGRSCLFSSTHKTAL